ncbi:bile acid:sodium symporter family protein [Erythrobacter sp. HL-111]|uniref:bile acid:sodium symporter family protein n=1 Tax=Erythrobacter sp. HL-111 TaxID=1798193 RepID=UPI0006DBBA83|nr:bile acid:sodium symporter family protein [Erythrobacter sp. HL-111]KPP89371.1 MAG: solute carrier family 10 (sodium/bile acid cotransporter), member 7 [Erythrobacteraceae bacterium HL-111]SDR87299.1 solute carrier family 10 (sodium/bile acid cotransporter), member 7 [Erythrobacter sp. HL-111]
MPARFAMLADPMIAVLVIATALAAVLPATGEARGLAQLVSNGAIFVLFLVNGMRIARAEIAQGLANWRYFVPLLGWIFGVMALVGLGFMQIAQLTLPPLVALGFLYFGCLPSTVQSATSYTSLAGGNVALSVVGAALVNIAGVFVTAPLFALLGGGAAAEIGYETIARIGVILVLPFVIGQAVQRWTRAWVIERRASIAWLDRGVIGIAVYVAFSGAVEQGLGSLFGAAQWAMLLGLVAAFLGIAIAGAWFAGGALGLARAERIAFLFAGSQKSVAIGAPMAAILFVPAQAGFVIAPLLLYHLLQLVAAAPLASRLAREPR